MFFNYKLFVCILFTAGTSWDALRYGSSSTHSDVHDNVLYAEHGGLGFVKNYIVDSHFR